MCIGSIVECAACGALSCCVGASCSLCGKTFTCHSSTATRFVYLFLWVLTCAGTWAASWQAGSWLDFVPQLALCQDDYLCLSTLVIFRLTFALAVFHFFLALLLVKAQPGDARTGFDDGWWIVKLLLWAGFIVGSMFIPEDFFIYYSWIARFGAAIFCFIQLYLLVDWAFQISTTFSSKADAGFDEGKGMWFYILIGCTVAIYLIALVGIILLYVFYAPGSGCGLNVFFITLTLVWILFFSWASISERVKEYNERSGLFQSSVVAAYSVYLLWSALSGIENSPCNPWEPQPNSWSSIVGSVFALISVCYASFYLAGEYGTLVGDKSATPLIRADDPEGSATESNDPGHNRTFFHLSFAFGALYLAMLLSNWSAVSAGTLTPHDSASEAPLTIGFGAVNMWIKIVSGWITMALYTWTLYAPVFFPDRDWS